MSRLSEIFLKNEKCFIPFVTAGHPDLETTEKIILRLAEAGSHIIEIGIPFSDPIADGPIIQRSSYSALKNGHTLEDILEMVHRLRQQTHAGLIFMSYLNPLLKFGLQRLDEEGSRVGLDGVLISDLTPEEYERMPRFRHLETVFLAAPTSSENRLERICRSSRGFIYLVARTGVTGKATQVGVSLEEAVSRIRRHSALPIAIGFGIDSEAAVRRVWKIADGAVVGSAIVRLIDENREDPGLLTKVDDFVRGLIPANNG